MKVALTCFSLFFLLFVQAQTSAGDQILGDWISPEHDLIVRCYKTKNAYYSKIVWFKRYNDAAHDAPVAVPEDQWMNTVVMQDFIYEDEEWVNGQIYNLRNGKKYTAYLKLNNANELKVVGYVYFRIFSETIIFRRYTPHNLPRFE